MFKNYREIREYVQPHRLGHIRPFAKQFCSIISLLSILYPYYNILFI